MSRNSVAVMGCSSYSTQPMRASTKLCLPGVDFVAFIDPIAVDIHLGAEMVDLATVLRGTDPALESADALVAITKGRKT